MPDYTWPQLTSLNDRASRIVDAALNRAAELEISVHDDVAVGRVIDFAVGRTGTIAAGLELARICMAGLAEVSLLRADSHTLPWQAIQVVTESPVEACIASQYAGWPISVDKYFAMGSGPARILRGRESVLEQYSLQHQGGPAVVVLETNLLPDSAVVPHIASECSVDPANVTACVARTASLPGCVQVVARSVEVALHKLHELDFDLSTIKRASGIAPLPPVPNDDLTALGRTNDAILYGGTVELWVDAADESVAAIGSRIPSCGSDDFGEPFLSIFKRYDMDFYKIDKMLFSPAVVVINNLRTGRTDTFGEVRMDILRASFDTEADGP